MIVAKDAAANPSSGTQRPTMLNSAHSVPVTCCATVEFMEHEAIGLNAAQVDRAVGVLVGAACGDALGAGYEFGTAVLDGRPNMIGGGLGSFAPGEWTDDTAQTYAIARVAATGADLRTEEALDQVARGFADWWADNPPDVGILTRQVLGSVGPRPAAADLRRAAGGVHTQGRRTGGNGTLMRTSPVALAHLDDPEALVASAIKVATLTHFDPVGGQACALWCLAIRHAILEGELPDLNELVNWLPTESQPFWHQTVAAAQQDEPSTFKPNGYVVTALQAAWSAITHTPVPDHDPAAGSFASQHLVAGIEAAVAIGDDTDTVASIAGALLGARWGFSAIPWEWRRIVHGWPGATANDLANLAVLTIQGGVPDRQGWPSGSRIDYSQHQGYDSFAVHPRDPGVYLSGAAKLDELPTEVEAVVSLARLGIEQVPPHVIHAEFRIIDSNAADNPNLAFAIDDAAHAVKTLRDEGHTVLLHCVAAQSRTPTVAARYGMLLGQDVNEALADVVAALPEARPNRALLDGLNELV